MMRALETEMMDKHGWYAHYVTNEDGQSPTGYNAHTHGLEAIHLNFQVVFSLPPKQAHRVLAILAERVKGGERFEAGQEVDKVIQPGYTIKLALAMEGDRQVLRVIFPDAARRFGKDADEPYNIQYGGA